MSFLLYVEDDPFLQIDGQAALGAAGYDVVPASTGIEACEFMRTHRDCLGVLVTDINLCGRMTGWQVAVAGRELSGSLPVVYLSASDAGEFAARGVPGGVWISKPFEWAAVVETIGSMCRGEDAADREPQGGSARSAPVSRSTNTGAVRTIR